MSNRLCYIHNGVRRPCDDCNGCECIHALDYMQPRKAPYFGVVPGGSKDTEAYRWHIDFDPGMDAYKKAREEGLQPDTSDLKGVAKAHKRVKSQEDALRKIRNFSDIDGMKTTPGVDRDVK